MPEKIPILFHNESNYDYHFIIKELAEEFKKQFTCLRENSEKFITFTIAIEKEVTRHLTFLPDLWQTHYQILLIIFLKEFINVNTDMTRKI